MSDVASGRTDVELRNRDEVYIPNVFDLREDYSVTVRGEVNAPQTLDYRDGMTVEDVIVLCGGLRESASRARVEVARRIKDPTPLDYDVHDLMTYNAIAQKEGRPELTYGYWAAAGKPARP